MAAKLGKTDGSPVVDLAVMVASPALIMLMVGSLVWFLVHVLSPSSYPDRLLWCLSFFVFGAVLIARLVIEEGYSYASVYAAGLGGATFLAMLRFVEYPNVVVEAFGWLISFGLMALTWWLANRLTWDCTHLDEDRKTSGRGILAAAGLDGPAITGQSDPETEEPADPAEEAKPRKKDGPNLMGWMERYWRYQEARRKKPHTPGTWVLYVGLAALPVFALGQSLVPAADAARRRATLMEAAVFVGSALGLLVTTSLMGLRRYLEQRNTRVPLPMTAGWLGLGAALILFFVVAAMVLPRPHSETSWLGTTQAPTAGDRSASQNAVVKDESAGKGEGSDGSKSEPGKNDQSGKDGKQSGQDAGEGKKKGNGEGEGDGDSGSGGSKQGKSGQGGRSQSGKQSGPSQVGQAIEAVGSLAKWLVFAVIVLAVLAGAVFFVLKGLAPFTAWARNLLDWFRNLFVRRTETRVEGEAEEEAPAGPQRPPPFASFRNPFADGGAKPRRSPAELAAYTFSALDSWAWDRDAGRRPGETPTEFAARLGADHPDLDAPVRRTADLVVRALYSKASLPADAPKVLAALWKQMEAASSPAHA